MCTSMVRRQGGIFDEDTKKKLRDIVITFDLDNTDMVNLDEETFNMGMMSSSWKKL